MLNWFEDLQPAVQAAVVAGGVAILTAVITATSTATNVFLKDRLDRRASSAATRELRSELYRKYADPLTSAAESLYWRLREVFEVGRSTYLQQGGGLTRFERYKASSTRYRLAALLGWMRALKRELVLCDAEPDASVGPMRDALHELETSLAEGAHIERDVVGKLAQLWRLKSVGVDEAGRDVNAAVDRALHEHQAPSAALLPPEEQSALLRDVADVMNRNTHNGAVSHETVDATAAAAVRALSTREAWLYRDWQHAIGDWMLIENAAGVRRFDVKGFGEYEADRAAAHQEPPWLQGLAQLTDDLDIGGDDDNDARIGQLKGVYRAVANLILSFHEAEPERSSVAPTTLDAVRKTLELATNDPAAHPRRR